MLRTFAAGLLIFGCVLSVTAQTTKTKAVPKTLAANNLAEQEAQRGEWSRWRGPNGDGISAEKGLLKQWPEEGPPLAWKIKGLGKGYSSVSLAGGKIFTQGQKAGKNHLICLNATDGSELWSTPFGGGEPNCTPTIDGKVVYGLSREGDLACFNIADGKEVWSKSYTKDFGSSGPPTWGYSESPLIDGDRLICTPGSKTAFLAALNKATGETIWTTEFDGSKAKKGHGGAGYSSVVISQAGGAKQYVTLTGSGVVSVDPKDGKLLWGYDRVANGTANIPTPLIKGDFIFCSSGYGDGGSALLKISKQGNSLQPQEIYYMPANKTQNHHGGMILLGDYIYMGEGHNNGFPLCLKMADGTDGWRPGRGAGKESAAIAYADGHLYFRYQDGTMALVEANSAAYKLKSSFKLPVNDGPSWPHPVIAGGKLYLRYGDSLLCYDVRDKTVSLR